MYIAGFLVCAIIIFFAGKKLSFYGDLLADMTGMGKAFIGLILMSTVTSLPELMVGISSVSIVQSADLAMGDILGSCALNLSILSLMDVFTKKDKPLFSQVSKSHILAAAFGIILLALTGLGLFFDRDIVLSHTLGITSIGFGVIYFMSVRTIFKYQKSIPVDATVTEENHTEGYTLRGVILRYSAFALVIIVVALALPFFAEHIAEQTGLGKSFVGTLFLAVSTSLPEIAVSLAAVRMGSPDMAVGNLLGSNIFNIFILFIDDILYTKGLLLKDASDINVMTVFMVVVMTAVAVIGFIFPYQRKRIFLAWDTLVIFLLYVVNLIFLYNMG
ncbi:sodium:calcium antiporter [Flavobacterium alkalisoli]|uniref:sodium:calcium antiporter n=1 Tax=Flavobacterium alkalisoli TaxID=2602769 RepID=UPI003A915C86